jgi:hypothetical protein
MGVGPNKRGQGPQRGLLDSQYCLADSARPSLPALWKPDLSSKPTPRTASCYTPELRCDLCILLLASSFASVLVALAPLALKQLHRELTAVSLWKLPKTLGWVRFLIASRSVVICKAVRV